MKRLLTVLLLVLIAVSFAPSASAFDNVNPIATGYYADRFTDTALYFTSTTVSLVQWPSGVVIWTMSVAANITDDNGTRAAVFHGANFFEFVAPKNSAAYNYYNGMNTYKNKYFYMCFNKWF